MVHVNEIKKNNTFTVDENINSHAVLIKESKKLVLKVVVTIF